jgi:Zn-dependent protease
MLLNFNNPIAGLLTIIAFLVAISVHECAHAYVSDRLGDPTARLMGRLTLNPLAHLDLLGTLLLLVAPFGWAKPVQVDIFNLRNPRRDSALISLAGPIANILTAILFSILLRFLSLVPVLSTVNLISTIISYILQFIVILNVNLAIFNLIPIHPLDGFAIVRGILPEEYARQWQELQSYGMIFLLFLIFPLFGGVSPIGRFVTPITQTILNILLPQAGII